MVEESYDFNYYDVLGLALWLGLLQKRKIINNLIISFILFGFLEALFIVTPLNDINPILCIIPFVLAILLFSFSTFHNYKKRQKLYFHSLDNFYNNYLKEYDGYNKQIVGLDITSNSKKFDNNFIMLTNGYKFIFLEDPLKNTKYRIKNRSLKVLSSIENFKLEFLNTQIKNFSFINGDNVITYNLYDTFINMNSNVSKVVVTLEDFTTFEISANAYELIKNSNPLKEIKNERELTSSQIA